MNWQPIETYEGGEVLLTDGKDVFIGLGYPSLDIEGGEQPIMEWMTDVGREPDIQMTHWMRLPEPPR